MPKDARWAGPKFGYTNPMISAIFDVIRMVVGLVLDIVTLPFRVILAC